MKSTTRANGLDHRVHPLKFVTGIARPRLSLFAGAFVVALVEVASILIFPLLTKDVIDSISHTRHASYIGKAELTLVAALLAGAVASGVSKYMLSLVSTSILARLQLSLADRLINQSIEYFDASSSGSNVSLITNDTRSYASLISDGFPGIISGILVLAGSFFALVSLDAYIATVVICIFVSTIIIIFPLTLLLTANAKTASDQSAKLSSQLTQVFGEIRLVKAHCAEPAEVNAVSAKIVKLRATSLYFSTITSIFQPLISLAACVSILCIIIYGGQRAGQGLVSPGTLTAFLLYIFNMLAPMLRLSSFLTQYQVAQGASLRLMEALEPPLKEKRKHIRFPTARDTRQAVLSFENITFSYREGNRAALQISSMDVTSGSCLAVVGPSGSGKSTLFSLIERFYKPQSGRILYYGGDIDCIDLVEWRRIIGYVAQDTPLLSGTIRTNVAYGMTDLPSDSIIWDALAAANCADFVKRMPAKLDTQVGERGVLLSGGQRQRIAVSRLFIKNPEIILLDEATASLDPVSEQAVVSAIGQIMHGRTSIMSTHRMNTIPALSNIAVFEDGYLTDAGNHDELIKREGYYRRAAKRLQISSMALD